jgi:dynein intermediate chain 3, axonemal
VSCPGLHHGPVVAVQWSQFFPESLFLTAGDWSVNVCSVNLRDPIVRSPFLPAQVGCARWSPTRAAVFFVGRYDGSVDIWDLLDRSSGPCFTQVVSSNPITAIHFLRTPKEAPSGQQQATQFVAVGDAIGVVHVLEVPRNFSRAMANEAKHMAQFVEREVARVSFVRSAEATTPATVKETAAAVSQPSTPGGASPAAPAHAARLAVPHRITAGGRSSLRSAHSADRQSAGEKGIDILSGLAMTGASGSTLSLTQAPPEDKEVASLDAEYKLIEATLLAK